MSTLNEVKKGLTNFSHPEWTDEILQIVLTMSEDIDESYPGKLSKDTTEPWVAGILSAALDNNFILAGKEEHHITTEDIQTYTNVPISTIEDKMNEVKELLPMDLINPRYTTQGLKAHSELLQSVVKQALFDDPSIRPCLLTINKKTEFSTVETDELEADLTQKILDFEEQADDQAFAQITSITLTDENRCMEVMVDCSFKLLDVLSEYLVDRGYTDVKCQLDEDALVEDPEEVNLYAPDDLYTMFIEQNESWGLTDLETEEEIQAFMETIKGKTPEEIREGKKLPSSSEAWLLALKAYHLPYEESMELLEEAESIDPDCMEASICLAGWQVDQSDRIDLLENALEIGEEQLQPDDPDFDPERWWTDHRTRPYLRAFYYLGLELILSGHYEDGMDTFMEAIDLDKADHLGIRYFAMEQILLKHDLINYRKVARLYPDDQSVLRLYLDAIFLFMSKGNKSASKKAAIKAFRTDPFLFMAIVGEEEIDDLPPEQCPLMEYNFVIRLFEGVSEFRPKVIKWFIKAIADCGAIERYWTEKEQGYDFSVN